jgi:hypothetical protein
MSRFVALAAGCCFLSTAFVLCAEEPAGVEVGKNLPGTFQPYNVNSSIPLTEEPEEDPKGKGPKQPKYTGKGKFHCLVTEYDLDPVVMLVARGLEENAAFRDLLTKLDAALDRNKVARLRCFVVFQDDALTDVITQDDKRDEIAKKLDKLVLDAKLKNVVVCLAGKDDLAKYKLDPTTALTAVLYKKLRVEAIHKVGVDKIDVASGPEVKAILTEVGTKLGAAR